MLPEPTMKIIGWAASRGAEAIVVRIADRVATKLRTHAVAKARQHVETLPKRRGRTA